MENQTEENKQEESSEEEVEKNEEESEKKESPNMIAILCYLGILVIVPLLVAKDDEFVNYHIKQGLVLLITFFLVSFIPIINLFAWIVGLVFMIMGIINVVNGKKKEIPLIGQFAEKFKI